MLLLLIVQIHHFYSTVQRESVTVEPLKMTESSFYPYGCLPICKKSTS